MAAGSPLEGAASVAAIACTSRATASTPCCASAVCPSGPLPFCDLLLRLLFERPVDDFQQRVVLPQAHPERDRERDGADDQARAQLIEMVDEAELVFVADRADRGGHVLMNVAPRRLAQACFSGCNRSRESVDAG